MKTLAGCILLIFSAGVMSVLALVQLPAEPCDHKDMVCLRKLAAAFLELTAPGVPELGIAPTDPMVVPPFDVSFEKMGLNFKLKNINVSGLKNMFLDKFILKKHVVYRSVNMVYKCNLTIASDITIDSIIKSKTYDGSFTSRAYVSGEFTFTFDQKKKDQGSHHFDLSKHVLTCELDNSPKLKFNSELAQKLDSDDNWKNLSDDQLKVIREVTFCKIAREVYDTVLYNYQKSFEVLPGTHFLKNMD